MGRLEKISEFFCCNYYYWWNSIYYSF